jgi:hypothetical protein
MRESTDMMDYTYSNHVNDTISYKNCSLKSPILGPEDLISREQISQDAKKHSSVKQLPLHGVRAVSAL